MLEKHLSINFFILEVLPHARRYNTFEFSLPKGLPVRRNSLLGS